MTSNIAEAQLPSPAASEILKPTAPSTAGMTTKVVKGSLWTLGGQILPMLVSFVSTPFIIRFLGSEKYGVLILVGLIPTYFSFADFGMGIASTKYGSEAYGQGNREKEAEIVRTAAVIAFCSSMLVALPIIFLSSRIIELFNVPPDLFAIASLALKLTSIAFVLGVIAGVVNTPMLARLRMDMNSVTSTIPKILVAVLTPLILYFGGGLIGAVWVAFLAGLIGTIGVFYFSGRILPEIYKLSVNREYFRPLLKFGFGWIIASIAAILVVNFEKLVLSKYVSVSALAFYSVAFTLANMTLMFSTVMTQSLIPAFSQLQEPAKRGEFDALFSRGIRLSLICMLPFIMFMFVIARPFFTIWAGEEFGRESTVPFYILLLGLMFNMFAIIPHTVITSMGRTDILAKVYWIELVAYVVISFILIFRFQIVGAAVAWTVRVIIDAFIFVWLSKRTAGITFGFGIFLRLLLLGGSVLVLPVLIAVLYNNFSPLLFVLGPGCAIIYATIVWKKIIDETEKAWFHTFVRSRALSIRFLTGRG